MIVLQSAHRDRPDISYGPRCLDVTPDRDRGTFSLISLLRVAAWSPILFSQVPQVCAAAQGSIRRNASRQSSHCFPKSRQPPRSERLAPTIGRRVYGGIG